MPKVGSKRAAVKVAKGTKAAGRKQAATVLTFKALKGTPTAQLLAVRAGTPRANLAGHYAIRRALRANGYFISQNR